MTRLQTLQDTSVTVMSLNLIHVHRSHLYFDFVCVLEVSVTLDKTSK